MTINKELFYTEYRKLFGSIKKEETVECIDSIINYYETQANNTKALAYILATVRHECGPNILPITENLNYSAQRLSQVWPSRFPTIESTKGYANAPEALGNRVYGGRLGNGPKEGYKYRGRGFVQITGKTNYQKFSDLLDIDLINNPDLAKDVDIGSKILVIGMLRGMFTGKKLSDYFTSVKTDYYNARDIINVDKGRVGRSIEADAKKFYNCLTKQ